jgi:hypothetical protein
VEPGARGELHLVPPGSEGPDDGGRQGRSDFQDVDLRRTRDGSGAMQSFGELSWTRRYASTHSGRSSLSGRGRRSPLGEPPHQGRHVLPRGQLRDQLLDLPLGPMRRPPEKHLAVLLSEVRRQLGDPAQVKPPVAQHGKDHGVLARGPGHGDAQVGLGLREAQGLRAVGEHGGEGFMGVEASLVHLGDVGDEVPLDAARLGEDLPQAAQEIVVGDCREGSVLLGNRRSDLLGVARSALVVHGRRLRPVLDSGGPLLLSERTHRRVSTRTPNRST